MKVTVPSLTRSVIQVFQNCLPADIIFIITHIIYLQYLWNYFYYLISYVIIIIIIHILSCLCNYYHIIIFIIINLKTNPNKAMQETHWSLNLATIMKLKMP